MDSSLVLLFGRARALVLEQLFRAEGEGVALHLRELVRRTGLSISSVQYELGLLRQLELIKDIGSANRPAYVLSDVHVFHQALGSMFKTTHHGLLGDDAHFAEKRLRQQSDRRQSSEANSAFLTKRK